MLRRRGRKKEAKYGCTTIGCEGKTREGIRKGEYLLSGVEVRKRNVKEVSIQ